MLSFMYNLSMALHTSTTIN